MLYVKQMRQKSSLAEQRLHLEIKEGVYPGQVAWEEYRDAVSQYREKIAWPKFSWR